MALLPVGAPGSRLPRSPVWQAASDVSEYLTGTSRCWPLDWMLDVSGSDYASFLHVASKQQQPPTCIHFVLLLPSRSSPDQNTISGANHFGSRSPPRSPVPPDPCRAPLACLRALPASSLLADDVVDDDPSRSDQGRLRVIHVMALEQGL